MGTGFGYPWGVATDGAGNVYVSDMNSGAISSYAFPSGPNTPIITLPIEEMGLMKTDGTYLYVAGNFSNQIHKIKISDGTAVVLAGAGPAYSGTGGAQDSTDGMGDTAEFSQPSDVELVDGVLYVTDYNNCTIRSVDPNSGDTRTFAGTAGNCVHTDGVGPSAAFNYPNGITSDGAGHLYVTEWCTIREIDIATAKVTTYAGQDGHCQEVMGSLGGQVYVGDPSGITHNSSGLFFTDYEAGIFQIH